jgi:hypothetical protein
MASGDQNFEIPVELRPIAAAVDDLAHHERAAAPTTLEDRLFMATQGTLTAQARGAPVVVRRVWMSGRLRLAASIALAGGIMAVWLGRVGMPAEGKAARLESDMDLLVSLRSGDDGIGDALNVLQMETDTVSDSLKSDWPSAFDGGSM